MAGFSFEDVRGDEAQEIIESRSPRQPPHRDDREYEDGVMPRGEGHPLSELTEDDVRWICQLHFEAGWSYKKIARWQGASFGHVGKICRGEKWSHLHIPCRDGETDPEA